MKRWISTLLAIGVVGIAAAQAPFTIVRPSDGAKVREKVRILIPKNSVPRGGYIGMFIDGKFIEATVPNMVGRYYEYTLDTKGRGIADGKHTIEAVLYMDYNNEPRIVDRSSIEMTIANKANIPIPDAGLQLRYKFQSGDDMVYTLLQRVAMNSISTRQQSLGGRAAELPLDYEKVRMLYAVENSYGNGDGLVRMQALPLKGKRYAMLTPSGQTSPQVYYDTEMHPIYMRLTNTGMEVFGSVPEFIPFEGINSEARVDLYANFPLPTLPTKRVRPGDVWQTRFQIGTFNLANMHNVNSVIESMPARGEFLGLEWEMGHPCAKIKHSLAAGARANGKSIATERTSMEELIWFALDRGEVLKVVRTISMDSTAPDSGGGAPGSGAATPSKSGQATGGGGARGGGGRGRGGVGGIGFNAPAETLLQGGTTKGAGARQAAPQSNGNGRFTGTRAPGVSAGGNLIRITYQQIYILEK